MITQKFLMTLLTLTLIACAGIRHGNPIKRTGDFAPITSGAPVVAPINSASAP